MFKMLNWLNPIWVIENWITCYWIFGDDPPPAAPTNQTITQVSIPEYIRPNIERLLGKTEALTDINQNPYKTYGGQRIADFSPMQQRAFNDVGNMQTAGQLGTASNLAGQAGLGAYGMAGNMANAGNNYYGMATNPYTTQAFMNPYIQSSLAPQLNEMRRQYGIAGTNQMGNATKQGAFGGSREALMASENNRNMNTAMNQTIGQGYDKAFQAAQQAQQFGANLGLQGQQGALQGYGQANNAASILGQLGQTQFGQQQAINQAQQQVGTIQQAQAQQGLDQRYQDFLKQQNYPYQQLAFMSDMTRGLPLSQSATSMYQAPPSAISQLGGLGMAGLGIAGASGAFRGNKEGGAIKEKSFKAGGNVRMMKPEELEQLIQNPQASPMEVAEAQEMLMLYRRMQNNPQTAEIMGQSRAGIGAIATGDMVPEGEPMMAGGGIIAFKKGDKVEAKPSETEAIKARILSLSDELLKGNPFQKSEENQRKIDEAIAARNERMPYDILTSAGLATMAGTSPHALTNLGLGGQQGYKTAQQIEAENAADRKLAIQNATEQEKAEFARKSGILNNMQTTYGQMLNKELGLKQIDATRDNTNATRMSAIEQRDAAAAQQAYKDLYNKQLLALYAKEKLAPVKSSDQELAAMAEALAIKQLMPQYRKYFEAATPAASQELGKNVPLPSTGAPIAKAIPLPQIKDTSKLAASLVVGQQYVTNGGARTGVWDGKQFIPTNKSVN